MNLVWEIISFLIIGYFIGWGVIILFTLLSVFIGLFGPKNKHVQTPPEKGKEQEESYYTNRFYH